MNGIFASNGNKLFKLVLGLGNNSLSQITTLCEIYSQAGAHIFDLSPDINSLRAARAGVEKAGLNPDDFKYCVSFGVIGDAHIKKAKINPERCDFCFQCTKVCPQGAISPPDVEYGKCIGCTRCKICHNSAINFYDARVGIAEAAERFQKEGMTPDMVELHISSHNKDEIFKNWELILGNFKGEKYQKSICIDRSKYGDNELMALVQGLISLNPQKTIIQADGVPMSGAEGIQSTVQAVAHAQLYQDLNAYIFISGGTNCHTKKLAEELSLRFDGITIGSYARSSIKNKANDEAITIAEKIVNSVVK